MKKEKEEKKEGRKGRKEETRKEEGKKQKRAQFPSETVVLWHLNPNSSGVEIKNRYLLWTHWFGKNRKTQKWAPKN